MPEVLLESHDIATAKEFSESGFIIIDDIFSTREIEEIAQSIALTDTNNASFLKSEDLFAIRQFLKEVPGVKKLVFSPKLKSLIRSLFGDDYFVVKSIYFDKAERSNWMVPWHQDITISVDKRLDIDGFGTWPPAVSCLWENRQRKQTQGYSS